MSGQTFTAGLNLKHINIFNNTDENIIRNNIVMKGNNSNINTIDDASTYLTYEKGDKNI